MKKHAIIPVFIPHRGCPNDCVFCNQKAITARSSDVSPEDVRNTIETYLPTLTGRGLETIELAFFGKNSILDNLFRRQLYRAFHS